MKNEALLQTLLMQTPALQPQDAVKLLYQHCLGCGHLLPSEAEATAQVEQEILQTSAECSTAAFQPIGNGLCRVNLHAPEVRALPALWIARMMAQTALRFPVHTPHRLQESLRWLRSLTQKDKLPFSVKDLDAYLTAYAAQGYPPVSHSPIYRDAHRPAYRVVESLYGHALPLLTALQNPQTTTAPVVLVLDGDAAAGKTTLAQHLQPLMNAQVIHMDDFFLPPQLRTPERLQTPGGNVHYERFSDEVIPHLWKGNPFSYQRYDCQTGAWHTQSVPPAPVLLVEGSYSLHPSLLPIYQRHGALTSFLAVNPHEQQRRLLNRNPNLLSRFETEWIPLEKSYHQAYDIQRKADIQLCTDHWLHHSMEDEG